MIHPLIIHESRDVIFLNDEQQDDLRAKPRSILWAKDGLYGMIPVEIIQNELRVRDDRKKLGAKWQIDLTFSWMETVSIPVETGKAMEKCPA